MAVRGQAKFEVLFNYAVQRHMGGDLAGAEVIYRRLLQAQPTNTSTLINLAILLKDRGQLNEAERVLRRAVKRTPDYADAHNNLGTVLAAQGRPKEAIESYRLAIKLRDDYADAYANLGSALRMIGEVDEAVTNLEKAINLNEKAPQAHAELGNILRERGEVDAARKAYERALSTSPNDGGIRINHALLLPVIPSSQAEIEKYRERITANVEQLTKKPPLLVNPVIDVGRTTFYLAYHGADDRALQTAIARMYERACPSLNFTAAHCDGTLPVIEGRPIRIGCVSRYFRDHPIAWTFERYFDHFPDEQFDITLFTFAGEENPVWDRMAKNADNAILLPDTNLAEARRMIADEKLDVLIYPDIGMEPTTYFLAFSRLAPIQCVAGGHPVTTGIPTLDYWIGNDLGEPEGAEAHYSEKLIRLKGIASHYYRPKLPQPPKSRSELNLPDDRCVYLCPQSLFKFHPDFDDVLARILRGDPNGVLAIFDGSEPSWTKQLQARFQRTMPDVTDRILTLPRVGFSDFLSTLAVADVMLDTMHFSGGNTSFQGLGLGTPIVTWKSPYARGLVTTFIYRHMGYLDLIADTPDEYVEIALNLGRNGDALSAARAEIAAKADVVFENAPGAIELRDFILQKFRQAAGTNRTIAAA